MLVVQKTELLGPIFVAQNIINTGQCEVLVECEQRP